MRNIISISFYAIFGLFALYVLTTVSTKLLFNQPTFHYSEGERIGVLRKFSKKGIFYKTYEGELMLNAEMGSMKLDTFFFSVTDPNIADQLSELIGKKIILKYDQYLLVPYNIGDSNYIVKEIKTTK